MSLKYEHASIPQHISVKWLFLSESESDSSERESEPERGRQGGEAMRTSILRPGGNPGANLNSISHRCHLIMVAFVLELTKETIDLPLGCLQGGLQHECASSHTIFEQKLYNTLTHTFTHSLTHCLPPSLPLSLTHSLTATRFLQPHDLRAEAVRPPPGCLGRRARHARLGGAAVYTFSSLLLSSLELSGTTIYEPEIRALLGTSAQFCEVVVLRV